jgi:hypothetical protein
MGLTGTGLRFMHRQATPVGYAAPELEERGIHARKQGRIISSDPFTLPGEDSLPATSFPGNEGGCLNCRWSRAVSGQGFTVILKNQEPRGRRGRDGCIGAYFAAPTKEYTKAAPSLSRFPSVFINFNFPFASCENQLLPQFLPKSIVL